MKSVLPWGSELQCPTDSVGASKSDLYILTPKQSVFEVNEWDNAQLQFRTSLLEAKSKLVGSKSAIDITPLHPPSSVAASNSHRLNQATLTSEIDTQHQRSNNKLSAPTTPARIRSRSAEPRISPHHNKNDSTLMLPAAVQPEFTETPEAPLRTDRESLVAMEASESSAGMQSTRQSSESTSTLARSISRARGSDGGHDSARMEVNRSRVLDVQQNIPKGSSAIASLSSTRGSVVTELEMEAKHDDDFELVHRKVTRDAINVQPIASQIYDAGTAAANVSSSHSRKTTHTGSKSQAVPPMANAVRSTRQRGKNKASPGDNNSSSHRPELAQSSTSYPTRNKKARR